MAANENYINLRPDLIKTITETGNKSAEDSKTIISKLRNELQKICEDTRYEPMVNVINELITQINTEASKKASAILTSWESQADYRHHVDNQEGGEKAHALAQTVDKGLIDCVNKFWQNPMGDNFQIDTAEAKIDDSMYDKLDNAVKKAIESLKNSNKKHSDKLSKAQKDKVTTEVALPIVESIFKPMIAALEGFQSKIKTYKQEAAQKSNVQKQRNTQEKQSATSTALTAKEVTDKIAMFKGGSNRRR